jgi:hypothetical protein
VCVNRVGRSLYLIPEVLWYARLKPTGHTVFTANEGAFVAASDRPAIGIGPESPSPSGAGTYPAGGGTITLLSSPNNPLIRFWMSWGTKLPSEPRFATASASGPVAALITATAGVRSVNMPESSPLTIGAKSRHSGAVPSDLFSGRWDERHPLNTPGRYYGAATDTCCDGPGLAPASLLYDHEGCGFVWRQPRDESEVTALLAGARSDPFAGYADDGDEHWTPTLIRAWWSEQESRRPLVDALVREVAGPRPELPNEHADLLFRCLPIGGYSDDARAEMRSIVSAYLTYLNGAMADDLRSYIAYLDTGAWPRSGDTLPQL